MQFVSLEKFLKRSVDGRRWVYPQFVTGTLYNRRTPIAWVLIGIMVVLPLIRINGLPAVLLDIPHRRFVLFGTVFWPHDVWLMIFLVAGLAILLFFVTALWGRAWCGYACPQTVFLHNVFLRIERLIEGDRNKRIALDEGPWTASKVGKKILKQILFLGFSSFVAHIFLAYFIDVRELAYEITHPSWDYKTPILTSLIFTGLFYFNFAFLREHFCNYLCPYARFQSALLDTDSLIIAYDSARGEPRGKAKSPDPKGDCVDCNTCVVVCPQGIDIRKGLQLECIHCGLCADACDPVMAKLGRAPGLIRYASEAELAGKVRRLVRPRTLVYAALITLLFAILGYQLHTRNILEATLIRPAGTPYQMTADGHVANRFRVSLVNKDHRDHSLTIRAKSPENLSVVSRQNPVLVAGGSQLYADIFVVAATSSVAAPIAFELSVTTSTLDEIHSIRGKLLGPNTP